MTTDLTGSDIIDVINAESEDYYVVEDHWPRWIELQYTEANDNEDEPITIYLKPYDDTSTEIEIYTKYKIRNKRHSDYYNDEHTCGIENLVEVLDDYIDNLIDTFSLDKEDEEPENFYDESEEDY